MLFMKLPASVTLPVEVDKSTQIFFPQKDDTFELFFYNQPPTAACQIYNPTFKGNESSKLRVYPNPANNFITIAWNYKDHGNLDLTISDANGRTVYTKPLVGQNNETILDIAGFENGTYQVSLSSGNKNIATETVVIQK